MLCCCYCFCDDAVVVLSLWIAAAVAAVVILMLDLLMLMVRHLLILVSLFVSPSCVRAYSLCVVCLCPTFFFSTSCSQATSSPTTALAEEDMASAVFGTASLDSDLDLSYLDPDVTVVVW